MPRFFFNVTTDDWIDRDCEGTELSDAATARVEAVQCFGEIIRHSSPATTQRRGMAVHDGMGRAVASMSFYMGAAIGA